MVKNTPEQQAAKQKAVSAYMELLTDLSEGEGFQVVSTGNGFLLRSTYLVTPTRYVESKVIVKDLSKFEQIASALRASTTNLANAVT